MSDSKVKSLAHASFKARLAKLAAQDSISDVDFADAIYQSISTFGIAEQQFRNGLGLSAGTALRWTTSHNLPQTIVRSSILRWIAGNLSD